MVWKVLVRIPLGAVTGRKLSIHSALKMVTGHHPKDDSTPVHVTVHCPNPACIQYHGQCAYYTH